MVENDIVKRKIDRIKLLTKQLNQYRDFYYNNSISQISDYEYDCLIDELQQLENDTGFVLFNSPTHSVGYEVKSNLIKVKHNHLMLSLDKTKNVDDLIKFADNQPVLLMHKLDGLTISLHYVNGTLVSAETRGNGIIGEDVLHTVKTFTNVPLNINYKEDLIVDGEAIITTDVFEQINSKLPEDSKYKNPRNLCSGSVRQLDSSIAAKRNIKFIAWKVIKGFEDEKGINNDEFYYNIFSYKLFLLTHLGFDVVDYLVLTEPKKYTADDFITYINVLKTQAQEKHLPIDGLVISYENIEYGNSLGMTEHHFKNQLAYKFYDEEIETILENIEFTMGKTGTLTPTAIFTPIIIDGTEISRASLHNISICKNLQLGIGDTITVYKANQIIPQVKDNLTKSNTFKIPDVCPICGEKTTIIKENETEVLICSNENCKGKLIGKLTHFVSKNAMNIDGLSEQTILKLINIGLLKTFKDIYYLYLHKDILYNLEGFGKQSIDKLCDNIEKSKNTTVDRFIYAICIPLIGRKASKSIAKHFNNDINEFFTQWVNGFDFSSINDFGITMNKSMHNFIRTNSKWVKELINEFSFNIHNSFNNKLLLNKNFVITGTLTHYKNRNELINIIEQFGGQVFNSVSKTTSYLINNDINSNSSKNKKAKDLNIPIISEVDFNNLIS